MNERQTNYFSALATPLASIFGSGFLVIVPILAAVTGTYSILAIILITVIAYSVGEVIRFNIANAEPALEQAKSHTRTLSLERFSDLALVLAYIISISLYLRILSSFLLVPFDADTELNEQLVTTIVIGFIIMFGIFKGLKSIEKIEIWSLGITIFIFFFVMLDFGIYDITRMTTGSLEWPELSTSSPWKIATVLAGTLIVVQGFETSRYLGESYSRDLRISTSRHSQIISTVVYLSFIALATPLMHYLGSPTKSNDLILLAGKVTFFLPFMVISAAVLSQFSAAVADTIAGVGNLLEVSKSSISKTAAYLGLGISAIVLTWVISTFELVALASRAFAFYYLMQCLVAYSVSHTILHKIMITPVAIVLLFVTIFAVPVG